MRNYTEAVSKLARHYQKCPSQITEEEIRILKLYWMRTRVGQMSTLFRALKLLYTRRLTNHTRWIDYKGQRRKRP
ncbi:MAG: hypothetical protein IPK25_15200 [Saprospiraceae bacterium]|nr:hypothetical protein [Saprospiraceae bacterium]